MVEGGMQIGDMGERGGSGAALFGTARPNLGTYQTVTAAEKAQRTQTDQE